MLSAHAHTFRHRSRLAISLSWIAGYTNVIILIRFGETISHMTGNTTKFGNAIGGAIAHHDGAVKDVAFYAAIIGLFLAGAVVSGLMIESRRGDAREPRYSIPITLEAILLAILTLLMNQSPLHGAMLVTGMAAFAMGLQNATITRISGAVVRTTHLTGVVTDFGLELVLLLRWFREKSFSGHPLRSRRIMFIIRRQPSAQRVFLLASIFGSFLFGVIAGTVLLDQVGVPAMLAPVLFLTFIVLRDFYRVFADRQPVQ